MPVHCPWVMALLRDHQELMPRPLFFSGGLGTSLPSIWAAPEVLRWAEFLSSQTPKGSDRPCLILVQLLGNRNQNQHYNKVELASSVLCELLCEC